MGIGEIRIKLIQHVRYLYSLCTVDVCGGDLALWDSDHVIPPEGSGVIISSSFRCFYWSSHLTWTCPLWLLSYPCADPHMKQGPSSFLPPKQSKQCFVGGEGFAEDQSAGEGLTNAGIRLTLEIKHYCCQSFLPKPGVTHQLLPQRAQPSIMRQSPALLCT